MFTDLAYAMAAPQGGAGGQQGLMPTLLLFGVMAVIFYFFLIRPQSKRQKEHQNMINQLKRGDEVVTTGGIVGKIQSVSDTIVTLEVAQNVRIRMLKGQIAGPYQGETKEES